MTNNENPEVKKVVFARYHLQTRDIDNNWHTIETRKTFERAKDVYDAKMIVGHAPGSHRIYDAAMRMVVWPKE